MLQTAQDNFPSLLILNLEILNLGDFLQDQTEWKTEKKENLTINFIDLSNSYRFQNDNYCFFNSLNNSISNFIIYNVIENLLHSMFRFVL